MAIRCSNSRRCWSLLGVEVLQVKLRADAGSIAVHLDPLSMITLVHGSESVLISPRASIPCDDRYKPEPGEKTKETEFILKRLGYFLQGKWCVHVMLKSSEKERAAAEEEMKNWFAAAEQVCNLLDSSLLSGVGVLIKNLSLGSTLRGRF